MHFCGGGIHFDGVTSRQTCFLNLKAVWISVRQCQLLISCPSLINVWPCDLQVSAFTCVKTHVYTIFDFLTLKAPIP